MEHKKLRTFDFTANQGMDNVVVMYTLDSSNEMVKILIEPDERMKKAIKEVAPKGAYKC